MVLPKADGLHVPTNKKSPNCAEETTSRIGNVLWGDNAKTIMKILNAVLRALIGNIIKNVLKKRNLRRSKKKR